MLSVAAIVTRLFSISQPHDCDPAEYSTVFAVIRQRRVNAEPAPLTPVVVVPDCERVFRNRPQMSRRPRRLVPATLKPPAATRGSPMSSTSGPEHLSSNHRDTLLQIFQHPTSHNIEWHSVLSLLEAVGSVEQQHDGKFHVKIGDETEFLTRPKDKDIDIQQVVDVRRMLTGAGYGSLVADLESKGKED
jgi:hypothetical protein